MYLEENSLARCVLPKVRGLALKKKNKLFIDDAATDSDRMMMVVKSDDTAVCLSLCVGRRGGYGHLVGRTQVLSKLPFLFPFNNIDSEEVERFLDKAPQCESYYFGLPL